MLYVNRKNSIYHNYSENHQGNKTLNNYEDPLLEPTKLILEYKKKYCFDCEVFELKTILSPIDQE